MGRSRTKSGALGLKLGLICAGTALTVGFLTVMLVHQTLSSAIATEFADIKTKGWAVGLLLAAISGLVVGFVAYFHGGAIASRITELGLGVAKIGRGADVRVRFTGNDEISALGRALQYLASDQAAVAKEAEQGGGLSVSMDPLVRELRDKTVPGGFPDVEGFELDGAISAGSRGGMDYFDCVAGEEGAVFFLVSNEGAGPMSVLAARMARDEIMRALKVKPNARKALSHTNRVLHKQLPDGACAVACLVSLEGDELKLYQAGFRPPLLVCSGGRVIESSAEGLALGLDEGPVFEKGLRSVKVGVSQGVRVVLANQAAHRLDEFADLIAEHSAKHTAPFMNMVLGSLESGAGEGGLREDVVLLTAKRW